MPASGRALMSTNINGRLLCGWHGNVSCSSDDKVNLTLSWVWTNEQGWSLFSWKYVWVLQRRTRACLLLAALLMLAIVLNGLFSSSLPSDRITQWRWKQSSGEESANNNKASISLVITMAWIVEAPRQRRMLQGHRANSSRVPDCSVTVLALSTTKI